MIIPLVAAIAIVAAACGGSANDRPADGGDEPGGGVVGGGSTTTVVKVETDEGLVGWGDAIGVIAAGVFYFSNGTDTWLCESLAESYPPQCAGDRVAFEGDAAIDPDDLDEAQGIIWSAQPVTVLGSIVDGVFVATLLSQ